MIIKSDIICKCSRALVDNIHNVIPAIKESELQHVSQNLLQLCGTCLDAG